MAGRLSEARPDPVLALQSSALFRALPEPALRDLARQARLRHYSGRTSDPPICEMGERAADAVWLLLGEGEALAQVSFDSPGARRSKLGYRLMGGEVAGDLDLIISGLSLPLAPRRATIRALRGHQALELPASAIIALADQHLTFRRRLVRDAARRLADLLGPGGAGRPDVPDVAFACAMLDLFDDLGSSAQGPIQELAQKLSQQQVAEMMGMSLRSFSARATDWAARGLLDTAPLRLLDRDRIEQISLAATQSPRSALAGLVQAADLLIRSGERLRGGAMAADGLELWPDNPNLRYLIALALARSGDAQGAGHVLDHPTLCPENDFGNLRARVQAAFATSLSAWRADDEGESDETRLSPAEADLLCRDIAALQARLAKDRALALPDGDLRKAALFRAATLYADVDAASPTGFAAVNAATLLRLAGDEAKALRMARRAEALAVGDVYWDHATRGEAKLVIGEADQAGAQYRMAARQAPAGDVAAMRRQLDHLAKAGILGAADCLDALSPGRVLVVSGPVLAAGSAPDAVLAAACQDIQTALERRFADGGIERLLVSLASGADLVAARLAISAGVPVDAVVPFPLAEFRRTSVAIGGGARDWLRELDQVLPELRSLSVLWDGAVAQAHLAAHFGRANRAMLGQALLAARDTVAAAEVLAVGARTSAAGVLAETAQKHGLGVALLPPPPGLFPPTVSPAARIDPFAGVIFAHAAAPTRQLQAWLNREGFSTRATKSRRLLATRVLPDLAEAAAVALRLASEAASLGARVVLDHGPVLRRSGVAPDPEAMTRMAAAQAEIPALLSGNVTVSPAAALTLAGGGFPVGRLAEIAFDTGNRDQVEGRTPGGTGTRRLFRIY